MPVRKGIVQAADGMADPLLARVPGLDPVEGRPLTPDERAALKDLFSLRVLSGPTLPLTLDELVRAVSEIDGDDALPAAKVFAVSETGQIAWGQTDRELKPNIRYALTFGRASGRGAEILVSTRPPSDDRDAFLQVAAWDPASGGLQFFARVGTTWFWEGSSWHALCAPSRGKGAFDSHVNGAPVMKELSPPWLHWNSAAQIIPLESFPPDHAVRRDPYFPRLESAEILEKDIVRPMIRRWTQSRIGREVDAAGSIARPESLLRHLFTTTTVNIASSPERSVGEGDEITIPPSFFFDRQALLDLLGIALRDPSPVVVARRHYEAALVALDIRLRDSASGFEQKGDAFFAWPFPERAAEDQAVLAELLKRKILSAELLLSVLAVDFSNPIDSVERAALMAFVPAGPVAATDLEARLRDAFAAQPAGSTAGAVARRLSGGGAALRAAITAGLDAFVDAVRARARTPEGVVDLMRLADHRRRAFRTRKLAEFDLTLPFGRGAGWHPLRLEPDGSVVSATAGTADPTTT